MSEQIEGLDRLFGKLDRIGQVDLEPPVQTCTQLMQETAKQLCRASTGQLRESILTSVERDGADVTGRCYTNLAYAPYIEFGTGPKGQEQHEGISPNVSVSYSQTPWWIPEALLDVGVAEKYGWIHINTEIGRLYLCRGQPARPFLYPALKDNEERFRKIFENYVSKELK